MIIILMGVSGSGKTTVGTLLANKLKLPYYDADDFHPQANIQKMACGHPLDDDDRRPWLIKLAGILAKCRKEKGAVLACSALKESYRQLLSQQCGSVIWVHLVGPYELIRKRIESREGHFMRSKLLRSQYDILESPPYAIEIDTLGTVEQVVEKILKKIKKHG